MQQVFVTKSLDTEDTLTREHVKMSFFVSGHAPLNRQRHSVTTTSPGRGTIGSERGHP